MFPPMASLLPEEPNPDHARQQPPKARKKRNHPGNPDPEAEVVALSPRTLMTTNRFVCEICSKGFQRDQNLQLHRRGHNLPWTLRQKGREPQRKKVYVCPEPSCVHSHPSRALGDLTGIKKHFCRKHGEKLWRCDKCSKKYAVISDWKAHVKTCGTREYRCDCGTLFARKDSFLTHRAFCDALAEETARLSAAASAAASAPQVLFPFSWEPQPLPNPNPNYPLPEKFLHSSGTEPLTLPATLFPSLTTTAAAAETTAAPPPELSATALLQRASCMGCMASTTNSASVCMGMAGHSLPTWQPMGGPLTRDFLGGGGGGELALFGEMYDLVPATCQHGSGVAAFPHAWGGGC